MTTWVLLIVLGASNNASVTLSIPELTSYEECVRVERVVKAGPIGQEYKWGRWLSQCVEVKTNKD